MDPDTGSIHGLQPCSTDPFSWALGLPHAHCPLQGSHVLCPLSPPGSIPFPAHYLTRTANSSRTCLLHVQSPSPTPCFINPPATALCSLLPMDFSTHWNFGSYDSLHPPYQPRSPSPLCSISLAHFSHLRFDLWHYVLVLDQHLTSAPFPLSAVSLPCPPYNSMPPVSPHHPLILIKAPFPCGLFLLHCVTHPHSHDPKHYKLPRVCLDIKCQYLPHILGAVYCSKYCPFDC